MAINIADGFKYLGKKPLDSRTSYATVAEMKAVTDANISEGLIAYNNETDKYYKFKSTNSEDATTGKWREYNTGGDSGGGGGHVIEDSTGSELTQRDTMQFGDGITAEDDSTNSKTVIGLNVMTSADMDDVVSPLPTVSTSGALFTMTNPRWLRFDPSNKKGLVIKGGTSIKLSTGEYVDYGSDTEVDLTDDISDAGADYFVYLEDTKEIHAYTSKQNSGTYIGRFHTLCANAGTITMKAPASPSSGLTVGGTYLVKPYREDDDLDFYTFYNKTITAVSTGNKYDVITCEHPLSGYEAGDILPESIFCTSFKPNSLYDDAMVYDKATNIAVDVYLQSGTGFNTRSKYNQTHTVSREPYNHMGDMLTVGKRLLKDNEFTSIALGSNEQTSIVGSADKTTVGGHSDTAGRRMISAIGVEEACGYLLQWLQEVSSPGTGTNNEDWNSSTATSDGQGSFGKEFWTPYVALAGGAWGDGARAGSRCRSFGIRRSDVSAGCGGRGSSQVLIGYR